MFVIWRASIPKPENQTLLLTDQAARYNHMPAATQAPARAKTRAPGAAAVSWGLRLSTSANQSLYGTESQTPTGFNPSLVFRDTRDEVTVIPSTPDFGPMRQHVSAACDEQHPSMMRGDDVFLIDDPTLDLQSREDHGGFVQHALTSFDAGEGGAGPAEDGETDAGVSVGFGREGRRLVRSRRVGGWNRKIINYLSCRRGVR